MLLCQAQSQVLYCIFSANSANKPVRQRLCYSHFTDEVTKQRNQATSQDDMANRWQNQDSDPGSPGLEPWSLSENNVGIYQMLMEEAFYNGLDAIIRPAAVSAR